MLTKTSPLAMFERNRQGKRCRQVRHIDITKSPTSQIETKNGLLSM